MRMRKIKLDEEDLMRGYSLILHNDTVVYDKERGVYFIPENSVDLLKKNNIKFEDITGLEKITQK